MREVWCVVCSALLYSTLLYYHQETFSASSFLLRSVLEGHLRLMVRCDWGPFGARDGEEMEMAWYGMESDEMEWRKVVNEDWM